MAIILEIGTEEEKQLSREELDPILQAFQNTNLSLNLGDVILAADFDATVNALQGTSNYRSHRGVVAFAKCVRVHGSDQQAIVLSPLLFTDHQDQFTRYFYYMHEIVHVMNTPGLPPVPEVPQSAEDCYLGTLSTFLNEYLADRIAYGALDEFLKRVGVERSLRLQAYIDGTLREGPSLVNDPARYGRVCTEINLFKEHRDAGRFLRNVYPDFEDISLSLVHLWSLMDQYPSLAGSVDLSPSRFVNAKTIRLWEYLRATYAGSSLDLADGIDIVARYMENFGQRFEDHPQGLYCRVVDLWDQITDW